MDQLQAALDLINSPYDPLASRRKLMDAARAIKDRLVEVEAENIQLREELCDQLASAENIVDEVLKCGCPFVAATEHREKFPKEQANV